MLAINRRGITRTVILTEKWAIKIPSLRGLGHLDRGARLASFCRGVLANRSELEWTGVRGLNPVLWSFYGLVNVYKRAEPVDEADYPDDSPKYEQIAEDFVPIGDRKVDNIGVVDGQVVWIDFDYSWNGWHPSLCPPGGCNIASRDDSDGGRPVTDPTLSVLAKLASLVVHVQEYKPGTPEGPFDLAAARAIAEDSEVTAWIATLDPALLPEKR